MNLEDTMEQMLWVGEQAVTIGRVWDPKNLIAAIERVTPRQIRELAHLLFLPRRMHLAAVGPVAERDAQELRAACEA
jgi:predicted Zn-dependent peptidase